MPITYFMRIKSICEGCSFESRPDSCSPITFEGVICPCSTCLLKVICKSDCTKMKTHVHKCYQTLFDNIFTEILKKHPQLEINDVKKYRFGIDLSKTTTTYLPTRNAFKLRFYIYDCIEYERYNIFIYKKKQNYNESLDTYTSTGFLKSR